MKRSKYLGSLIRSLLVAIGLSAAVPATAQSLVFPAECADCHGPDPAYEIRGARMQYLESGHYLGFDKHEAHAWYANGDGCQQCHTHEGFVEYVRLGKIESEFIRWPSQPGCMTCHAPHETGDFSLRKADPVTLVTGAVVDLGKGNLCANCHTARRAPADVVVPTPASKVSAHFGPHHGPQSNLVAGSGAYEYPGRSYTNSEHRIEIKDSCIDCHMPLPEGRYRSDAALGLLGGHSFFLGSKDHDGNVKLATVACAECHAGIRQARDSNYYNLPATDDYDGDGQVEVAQAEVAGLLELLVNANGTGLLQSGPNAMFGADGAWNAVKNADLERGIDEMAALFNYKFFAEDRSMGVHNMPYTVQVLMDTVATLDPDFDTDARPD